MLERFTQHDTPEIETPHLISTLIVFGTANNITGQNPVLDPSTRITTLAAGLLVLAGIAKAIVLFSNSPVGTGLMRNYLKELDIPSSAIRIGNFSGKTSDYMSEIKRIIKSHKKDDVGIITAHSEEASIKDMFGGSGIHFQNLSPDTEIGERLGKSAQASRHAFTEVLKETFVNLIRYQKMLENVRLSRLSTS
jgi:hypothetical protein